MCATLGVHVDTRHLYESADPGYAVFLQAALYQALRLQKLANGG